MSSLSGFMSPCIPTPLSTGTLFTYDLFKDIVRDMEQFYLQHFNLTSAEQWGQSYWEQLSPDAPSLQSFMQRDSDDLLRFGSLAKLASLRHSERGLQQLSSHRIDMTTLPIISDPDCPAALFDEVTALAATLRYFASTGVPILTNDSFSPSPASGPPSKTYATAPSAVDAHIHKNLCSGLGVLLSPDLVPLLPTLNVINLGLAPKKGKAAGRLTINPSGNAAKTPPFLNNALSTDLCEHTWGEINYPTIISIIRSILDLADRFGRDQVVVWKTDLKGAFTLLKFDPDHVHLMSSFLSDGSIYIGIRGNFGWSGMPFAFNITSRFLEIRIRRDINGTCHFYCDDAIGISILSDWVSDRTRAISIMTDLFGDDAEEPSKRESSADDVDRCVTVLGWSINLSHFTVDISSSNRMSALYIFWNISFTHVTKREWETICSLASRYSLIFPELAPFNRDLFAMMGTWSRCPFLVVPMTPKAETAIRLWRVLLLRTEMNVRLNSSTGRPLELFRLRPPSYVIEFDGSLTGVGFRIFALVDDCEILYGAGALTAAFDLDDDSSYQNTMELAAVVSALVLLATSGVSGTAVRLRGDSVSVLTWLSRSSPSIDSSIAKSATIAFVACCLRYDFVVDPEFLWIAGTENVFCDSLSRGDWSYLTTLPTSCIVTSPGDRSETVFSLINPLECIDSESEFFLCWNSINRVLS